MWNEELNKNHIRLSETYASRYDESYGTPPTKLYMDYEIARLEEAINALDPLFRSIALDVGCGTGRCSRKLSPYFEQIIGFDFSLKMIEVAKQNAVKESINNIRFEKRDVNQDGINGANHDKAAFINFAFGMGSFLTNINFFVKEIDAVLLETGLFHISFYNRESWICKLSDLSDLSISAKPDVDRDQLLVNGETIFCKFYSPPEIKEIFGHKFREVSFLTYPTLTPFLKNDFIVKRSDIFDKCAMLDKELSGESEGYYISAIYQKRGNGQVVGV
jgi:SAM-dependent methyltransferase